MSSDNNEFADRQKSDSEEDLLKQERCLKRNYLEISCAAAASNRFSGSSTATAAIFIRFSG